MALSLTVVFLWVALAELFLSRHRPRAEARFLEESLSGRAMYRGSCADICFKAATSIVTDLRDERLVSVTGGFSDLTYVILTLTASDEVIAQRVRDHKFGEAAVS